MGYAVALYFDPETTVRIAELTAQIHEACGGLDLIGQGFQPHISLAGYEHVDEARLAAVVEALAARTPPMPIKLDAIGLFPTTQGVVYLAPVVTEALLGLHREYSVAAAASGHVSHLYYQPGKWIPHCTLAHDLAGEQVLTAVQLCLQSQVFQAGYLVALDLIEHPPARQICRFPLGG